MSNTKELQIEAIKSQQLINSQATRHRQVLIRCFALLAAQQILGSSHQKNAKLVRYLTGGGFLYLGLTGDIPLISWMARKNVNHGQINFKHNVLIRGSLVTVYSFLSDFKTVIRQIPGVKGVKVLDAEATHLEITLHMLGIEFVFELFIVKEKKNEFIGWSTGENSVFYHSGKMEFSPGPAPEFTSVDIVFSYTPPLGKIGQILATPFNTLLDNEISLFIKRIKTAIESSVPKN